MSGAPATWGAVRRLLVARLDNIGDIVLLSPALRSLSRALPQASITLLASPAGASAARLLPWVDDVLVHRAVWQQLEPGRVTADDERDLIARLRVERFDAAIICTSFSQTPFGAAYACFLAEIPLRAAHAPRFGGQLLTHPIAPPEHDVHEALRDLHLVTGLGFEPAGEHLEVSVPADAAAGAEALLGAAGIAPGERYAVLAPGASAPARRYPAERFAEAARLLTARSGERVVVVGSASEAALATEIVEAAGHGVVSLAGRTDIPELAAVIRRASVVLANNSLAMHLAEALGVPSAITYAGTDLPTQWGPRLTPHRLLRREVPCSPCFEIDCPRQLECLDVPAEEVAAATLELLPAGVR